MACLSVTARRNSRIGPALGEGIVWFGANVMFHIRHPTAFDWTRNELGPRIRVDWIEETLDSTVPSGPRCLP